ncbi:phosphoribosylamine--glycine ligase [Bacteriovorax sp. PP10]|uniref:Phosphoribosylamine--glycine ligase n=1 Tax=Bacteriovorax antarcticus TaxID=3088717 RepID=A0ABU5W1Q2_9BACT|nr:phosphoribosylamine--glycine ligase [Bacteriovorax sp. PP10]MEA9357750.1 phosphoribosylamine--glycine ligase [Bacteriovorax sp. PP10]
MRVLVVGSGGREHALCHSLTQSSLVSKVIVSPGNSGMIQTLPQLQIENIGAMDIQGLLKLALKEKVDLTVIGPEATLSEGIVDLFKENNLLIMGPTKAASLLETSKAFAKDVMMTNQVPTAGYAEFFEADAALKYIEESTSQKMVVKCDGLAQGKGVIVCQSKNEARIGVISLMKEKLLGENINHIIIEDFLEGIEVSAFALCDGSNYAFLGTACDHKRLRDYDMGPNTGGMGVFAPASIVTAEDETWINKNVFSPMIEGMKKAGTPFSGILFAGLMKTMTGWKVLEFNVRLGDPETQVLLPLLDEDLLPWLEASAKGDIKKLQVELGRLSPIKKDMKAVHVVMAAHGYPGTEGEKVRSGDPINFNPTFNLTAYDFLFMAGVEKTHGQLKTKGGRVLGITSLAETYTYARIQAYEYVSQIEFSGAQYRNDIARGQI